MDWSYIELEGGNLENDFHNIDESQRWEVRFIDYVQQNGGMPSEPGFGIFGREEGMGKKRVYRFYFTPAAKEWGIQYGAIPCEKPEHSRRLSLITGSQSSWELHYPDK